MNINNDYKIVIIGAGTAGLSAAIYALRAGQSVLVLDGKGYGGQIGSTDKVENYPGFKSISGFDFATALYEQAKALGAKIKFSNVSSVTKDGNSFLVETKTTAYKAESLIIASGLEKRKLGLNNEDKLTGKGVSYCATCDGAFYKDKSVAVIGGGNTALEDALYLSTYCSKVYLIHRRNQYRGEDADIEEINAKPNIIQLKSHIPLELKGNMSVEGLVVQSLEDNSTKELDIDGIFTAVGQIPSNAAFADLIDLDESGYIIAGEDCKTSVEGIFAAGDCRTKQVRQLVTAAADGAVAGISAAKFVREK